MFATQHYMDAVQDPSRKRSRDDEEASTGAWGFSEHRNVSRLYDLPLIMTTTATTDIVAVAFKRIQTLPLRSSPKVNQQWPPVAASTPVHQSLNESVPRSHFSPWSSSPMVSSQTLDADMDMSEDPAVSPSPYRAGNHSAHRSAGESDAQGRLPTPIQPTFAAQVRGQHCEWAGPGPVVKTPNGIVNMGHHQTGLSNDYHVPRAMTGGTDWQAIHNNRRLPSPISEAGDVSQCPSSGPTGMVLDGDFGQHGGQSEAQMQLHSPPWNAMHHPNAMMDIETHPPPPAGDLESDHASPPHRRGHVRSKHTVNSWTWQPGMKKSFSIGYRSDCEKCQLKVPGHFNHIVIS
ncbi:hypothetical protein HIM_01955 [Hirsutella minnesotensis 3608]|nr:hypothetical protein HIM_01955 [Hirsutella minnesotensis 3608]